MQNTPPTGQSLEQSDSVTAPENSLSYDPSQSAVASERSPHSLEAPSEFAMTEQGGKLKTRLRAIGFGLLAVLVIGGSLFVFLRQGGQGNRLQVGAFADVKIPLEDILDSDKELGATQSLKVNGRLDISDSVILAPRSQPGNPVIGQLYFDQDTDRMTYYDGQQFLDLQPGLAGTTIITNTTNIFGGSTTTINNSSGSGIALDGEPGDIAMFAEGGGLSSSLLNQSGTTLNIAAGNDNHTVQVGTGTGIQNVSVGSGSSSSTTTIQGGTGGTALTTGANSGVTGSISIRSGDSSTTASGNITIDTGEGVIDGEIINNKTFEGGVDSMGAWFGSTVAQSSAQAHTGSFSLEMTATNSFWGVEQLVLSAAPVIPGHQYFFSAWIRAGSTPRTISPVIVWSNSGGQQIAFTQTVDSASGWTQVTATGPAPATATGAFWRFSSSGAAVGEKHYFDDLTITDLSSSSAVSAISIGAENAKIITIGNLNQVGATSIYGSSGISLNSGAAGTTMQGGVMSITGHAASAISTTNGSLTLTSAAAATWGVGTATSGVGGNLTLTAGRGGTDANNNGGDLVLQGGAPNGTGTGGSVIVRPPSDSTDAFQVQNSASTPLLTVDSTGWNIVVSGTDTTYAHLTLTDAHFRSTQTTPPAIGTPANCGTSPAASFGAGATDTAGSFTITTGTGGTASTCDTTITFHRPYGAAPKSILIMGKTDTGSVARQIYVVSATASSFNTSFAASAAGANSTAYNFNYWVIE